MKLNMIFKTFGKILKDNSSGILMGAGIAGFGLSCYFSAKAYDECKNRLEQRKEDLDQDKLPITETIKVCWKPMLLPTISFISSSIMVLYSRNIILKKNAALLLAYKGAETALTEFQNETKAKVGEEVYNEIRNKTDEKRIESEELPPRRTYLDSNQELFFDGTYGGLFYSTEFDIYKAFEETRDDIKYAQRTSLGKKDYKEYVPLGDLYYRLHGKPLGIGDDYGYDIEKYNKSHTKLEYTITDGYIRADNGMKATVIYYDKADKIE